MQGQNLSWIKAHSSIFSSLALAHYQKTVPECLGKEMEQRNHPPKTAENWDVLKACTFC